MKRLFLGLVFLSFIAACDEKPSNPVSEYGNIMIDSYKNGQNAGKAANLDAIKKTLQAHYAVNEKYPANLDEVAGLLGRPIDTAKYDYNPQTGTVSMKDMQS